MPVRIRSAWALKLSLTTLAAAAAVALVAWLGGAPGTMTPEGPTAGGPVATIEPVARPAREWTAFDTGGSVAAALQQVADFDNPLIGEAELIAQDAAEATRRVLAALPVSWR